LFGPAGKIGIVRLKVHGPLMRALQPGWEAPT